jgi:hypothetical protein
MGLSVWLMSTLTISNAPQTSFLVKSIPPPSTSSGEVHILVN